MSVAAKAELKHDIEEEIGEFLTVKQTRNVSKCVDNVLQKYDVEQIQAGEVNTDMIDAFLDAKRVEGRSPKTINRYSYMLERMLIGIGKPIETISTVDLRAYFAAEKERGISDRSIDGMRSIYSSFFRWADQENMIRKNPVVNIGPIKYRKEIRIPLSNAEMERLKRSCDNTRDLTIICFLACTGARISEVVALNRDDIDFDKLEVTVLGKGNKERTVFFDDVTAELLKKYFDERDDDDPALFAGKRGRYTPGGIRALLNQIGDRAGVENVHPHRFRRTLATNLINHGMPIQNVAYILGHANVNTTMTYVFVDKMNVENEYRRYI